MRAPEFWRANVSSVLPTLLAPFERLTGHLTATRISRTGWTAPVPVICCGNVTVGGAGKTTLAIDLGRRLLDRGVALHFLTRGYGGSARGTTRVAVDAEFESVGDEARLLSAVAPTWIGADRASAARAAIAEGAQALVMDDGLQNPSLCKTASILVVDGRTGFGNGRLLPSGPLREPVAKALQRCSAVALIGDDHTGSASAFDRRLPIVRGRLQPGPAASKLAGQKVLAFAGIAYPEKFFATLVEAGAEIVHRVSFADHHVFSSRELDTLLQRADRQHLIAVTTAKDAVRLKPHYHARIHVADTILAWDDPKAIEAVLTTALNFEGSGPHVVIR